jgi:hypothetical protein
MGMNGLVLVFYGIGNELRNLDMGRDRSIKEANG